ncbi:MAG: isocitrate lyase/PEP mutase family protein [Oscillospiraceae bacterium]|nr:isocitrate lyase/PEP mutase family protein [Oscillospiraceae bacterium]
MSNGTKLRLLFEKAPVLAPFVYDGMMAKMAAASGMQALYCTGGGNSHSRGFPDVGLITMSEMTDKIRILSESSDLPIIADADTGYGSYANVRRTVRAYEQAGAAALHIEDQKWPKSCGYLGTKQVTDRREAIVKIKAAVDARTTDIIIIARTDALTVLGPDEVEERARGFTEAGADMVFADGLVTMEDAIDYRKRLNNIPLLFNNCMGLPMNDLNAAARFQIVIHPGVMMHIQQEITKGMKMLSETGISPFTGDFRAEIKRAAEIMGAGEHFDLDSYYQNLRVDDSLS